MIHEIDKQLRKCEQDLYDLQRDYPEAAMEAAKARYKYDMAWAEATDTIKHRTVADGKKPPTIPQIEAEVTKMVAAEMEATRIAEARLDGLKKKMDAEIGILNSVQSRAKLLTMEMSLAR